jgi:hypothetical protein
MGKPEIVTGTLINDRTVTLDKPLNLRPMKVSIAIEPLGEKYRRPYRPEVISQIHAAQAARGYLSPSREQVDRRILSERESWGD